MKKTLIAALALASAQLLVPATGSGAPAPAVPDPAKLDGGLLLLASGRAADAGGAAAPGAAVAGGAVQAGSGAQVDAEGRALVDVYVDGAIADIQAELADLGMEVVGVSRTAAQPVVEGWLPTRSLLAATALDGTRAVIPVVAGGSTGSVSSEGDAAVRAPQARATGATGAGVKVGIVSTSINQVGRGVAGSQASSDLPGPASSPAGSVTVLREGRSITDDEGRAMAEIVYDVAPGVRQMYFADGIGPARKASSIDALTAAGVQVITDDTYNLSEPFFQDGVVAQAVDRAAAAGVSYLVSAGNKARQAWEGQFRPAAPPAPTRGQANDFATGAGVDTIQTLGTFSPGQDPFISLQWDEPWGQATTDFALDLWNIVDGTAYLAYSTTTNNLRTGLPYEGLSITMSSTGTIGLSIRRVAGTHNAFMRYIANARGVTFSVAEHATDSPTIDPDASSARGAIAVAAAPYSTPTVPEVFTSRGPVTHLFDVAGNRLPAPEVRAKPDLASADGVSTTVPGFRTFYGTSAASPHAAGVAALIRSANPTLPAAGVRAILTTPAYALDCRTTAGQPDTDCGSGFIQADRMVAAARDASPPAVVSGAAPAPASGWFTAPVPVSWTVSDAESPVFATSGCAPTTLASTGAATCSATSAGGTATQSVSVKVDTTAPTGLRATGLKKKYANGKLPKKKKIHCQALDPESGIASCTIKGIRKSKGKHKVTVAATNVAGLVSTATFRYKVR